MIQNLKHHIVLHVIIFIWGFTAILGKFIDADAFVLVWYRVLIAFVSLFAFLLLLKRNIKVSSSKNLLKILGVGVIVALHWLFFYLAIKVSTASLAIICLSTTTLHVAWLEPWIMKRKPLFIEFALGMVIIVGILLITTKNNSEADLLGITYGLIAALLAALFSTFNAKLVQSEKSSKITLYEMLSATIVMSLLLLFLEGYTWESLSISMNDFYLLLFLGIICTSVAFLVTVEITKFLGAFTVSLSINMEPIYTLGLAIILLNEHQSLNLTFYTGATMIVLAVFGNAYLKRRLRKKQKMTVL